MVAGWATLASRLLARCWCPGVTARDMHAEGTPSPESEHAEAPALTRIWGPGGGAHGVLALGCLPGFPWSMGRWTFKLPANRQDGETAAPQLAFPQGSSF